MRKLIKSIFIILLVLLGLGTTRLLAFENISTVKDTLIVKQFSIDFPNNGSENKINNDEGVLTFRILAGKSTGLNADQILRWIEEGTLQLSGIRFDTDRAVIVNEHKLSISFEFKQPLQGEYLETDLKIAGLDWIDDAGTPVSLYGGSHSVMDLNLSGEGKRLSGQLESSRQVAAANFLFDSADLSAHHQPVFILYQKSPEESRYRSGFIYRNRYWVMGAATMVAGSATALFLNGGDSATYLPEPPGRP